VKLDFMGCQLHKIRIQMDVGDIPTHVVVVCDHVSWVML